MRILLSNDDGIEAYGIRALARALRPRHEVFVVAPDTEQSAKSHAITMGRFGLRYAEAAFDVEGVGAYRVFGTPADCVKFGILHLSLAPDLVIAGINHGQNVGSEIMYSGTVSAAFEGAYLHVRSMAVSCSSCDDPALFDAAAAFVADKLDVFCAHDLPAFCVLNINYPERPAIGYVYTPMGVQQFDDRYHGEDDAFYLRGRPIGYDGNADDCDVRRILEDYITITPLKIDRTDYDVLARLRATERT